MNPLDFSATDYLGQQLHTAETHQKHGAQHVNKKVDVVIVGSGPGGMVTGSVLAQGGLSVIVLEAGQFWPKGSFKRKQSWATKHLFQERGMRMTSGNAMIPLTSGRGVGGGTLVNSGICFRANDPVLDEWVEDYGLDFWARGRRETLYEEVEKTIGVGITPVSIAGNNSLIAKRGFDKMGIRSGFMPRNTPACAGCGTCQTGCPSGAKASADLNWLPQILRAGGELYADTQVEEILLQGGRATGVRAVMRDPTTEKTVATVEVLADKVILACGTIHTPMLLEKQNLANSSKMVGRNLRIHPCVGVVAKFDEEVRIWSGATQGYYALHPDDPEILLETFSASPEVFVSQAAGIGVVDVSRFIRELHQLAGCGALIRDHSRGVVKCGENGRAKVSYRMSDADRRKISKGISIVVDMFFEAGSTQVLPFVYNARFFESRNSAHDAIRLAEDPSKLGIYASHPMGTCRIGADPKTNVVRPEDGRTHDVEGLYITDASLFPTALGNNPQMTIMAQSLALARGMLKHG